MIHSSAPVPVALRFVGRGVGKSTSARFIARSADIHDAKALAALKTALSTEAEHMVIDVADPRALVKRCASELRATRFGKRGIFLIENDHSIVGYVDIHQVREKGAEEFASFNLAIRKEYWGNGLGSRLIVLAEHWAEERKFRFIIILVAKQNGRAKSLYDRLGYSVCDKIRTAESSEVVGKEAYIMGRMIMDNVRAGSVP
ncbi:MAG: ribosomal protein S18 acetylase RimI-like enzyme [Sphingomonas echinoides]